MTSIMQSLSLVGRQIRVLTWKNFVLRFRHYFVLFFEIAIPTLVILLIWVLKNANPPKFKGPDFPDNANFNNPLSSMYDGQQYSNFCSKQSLVWSCLFDYSCSSTTYDSGLPGSIYEQNKCAELKIAVAPHSSSDAASVAAANDFMNWVTEAYANNDETIPGNSNSFGPSTGPLDYDTFVLFDSESDILKYIDKSLYGRNMTAVPSLSSAIIFNSGAPAWDYTIRMNMTINQFDFQTGAVPTGPGQVELNNALKTNEVGPQDQYGPYLDTFTFGSYYFSLTDVVNSFIATTACRNVNICTSTSFAWLSMVGTVDFPYPHTFESGFWTTLGSIFALLLIISLMYPLANIIKALVAEKESKMREGMLMMALRGEALWFSWIIHFLLLLVPLSIILTFAGYSLFEYSSKSFIFCYFFFFFLAAMSFCVFISMFFTRARTAAIMGNLIFFGGFFITFGVTSTSTRGSLLLACLHPSAAFTYGTLAFQEYEDQQIGITINTYNKSSDFPITFLDTLIMLLVDFVYLLVLSWYIGNVWPSEYGSHKHFLFVFQPSYYASLLGYKDFSLWNVFCGMAGMPVYNGAKEVEMTQPGKGVSENNSAIEEVPESLAQQKFQGKCVDISNMSKSFDTPTGKKTAVDNLSLTIYSGQITALLGHNGAGKTTLVSMLTGLFSADSGEASILGHNLNTDMNTIRQSLGVCPQHDILFPDLTVYEHLSMFASFKGIPSHEIKEEVEKMISCVGLTEKRDVYAAMLSGGQKRKLSVGIAFIGNSGVVILDEPTSGMDPYSRRFTWNVIRQHREGRIVILITHFMDEADLLGDRIAIMGDGKVQCCGSPLFLKHHYGVGYNMTIEKADPINFNSAQFGHLVHSHVKGAKLMTDVGAELTYQLPFSGSKSFQPLFTTMEVEKEKYGIESFGMSVTTLEEVFIKIARGTHTLHDAQAAMSKKPHVAIADAPKTEIQVVKNDAEPVADGGEVHGLELTAKGAPLDEIDAEIGEYHNSKAVDFVKIDDSRYFYMFVRHVWAMLMKRYLYFKRDTKTWIYQFTIPVVFVIIGVMVLLFVPFAQNQPNLVMDENLYNDGITPQMPFPYSNGLTFCDSNNNCQSVNGAPGFQDNVMANLETFGAKSLSDSYPPIDFDTTSLLEMSQELLLGGLDFKASVFGAVSFQQDATWSDATVQANCNGETNVLCPTVPIFPPQGYTSAVTAGTAMQYFIHGNFTAAFSSPMFNKFAAEAYIKTMDPSVTIKTSIHPFPLTANEETFVSGYELDTAFSFLILGLAMLPAALAMNVVRERETKAKSQQMLSGVSVPAYWLSTFLWDNMSLQLTNGMLVLVFFLASLYDKTNFYEIAGLMWLLLVLFGFAVSGFSYILSFLFADAATTQVAMIFINIIGGFALSIVAYVMRILIRDLYMNYIRYLICLIPLCCVGEALHNIAAIKIWAFLELSDNEQYDYLDWDIAGLNLVMLGCETVVYLLIAILMEYVGGLPIYQSLINKVMIRLPKDVSDAADLVKDKDVLAEEVRVKSELANNSCNDTIVANGVHKMYYPGYKYAVKGVTLGIPNGECFGLLGINGAGKTTLLQMLTGEVAPTTGDISLLKMSMLTHAFQCRKHIGYCPQFDALFELLTAREHLALYARLKGIAEPDIERVVDAKIGEMGLTEYADRLAGTFSGGNKRKLSVAMAMIGEPSIVFLDEPSTGMDPAARRFMWDIITDIVTKREKCCLILTTHSMEEAEALCTRVGIMVGGVIRCLGSTQHLKTSYGMGYQIEIDIAVPLAEAVDKKCQDIIDLSRSFPDNKAFQKLSAISIAQGESFLLTMPMVMKLLEGLSKTQWCSRISAEGTGSDIHFAIENGGVTLKHFVSWLLLEDPFDALCSFMQREFGEYTLRERHNAKVRLEIPMCCLVDGVQVHHKLSSMFGSIEAHREALSIQGYSISQTSLEQIFNQFASQQEEEKGHAEGMIKH